jgi:phospholipid-translocating ATPase
MGDVQLPAPGEEVEKKLKRRQECLLREMGTALVICNNVTPVDDEGTRVLQASSPDEIALVRFA